MTYTMVKLHTLALLYVVNNRNEAQTILLDSLNVISLNVLRHVD